MTPRTPPAPSSGAPLAVVGMSCRLPAAANLDEFRAARDRAAVYEPVTTARLDALDLFDSAWFGLPEAEAAVLDPRERLALEGVVEAIDDAGVGYRIRGSRAAVLVTVGSATDFGHGRARGDIAQGIAHVLGLHGPTTTSEVADRQAEWAAAAARAFGDASVPFVIVVGVDVELVPAGTAAGPAAALGTSRAGGTPADSTAGPGGAPVRELRRRAGCGVLILQRIADAVRTGSRIRAEIDLPPGSVDEQPAPSAGAALARGSMPATRSVVAVIERVCALNDRSSALTTDRGQEANAARDLQPIAVRSTGPGPSARPADPPVLIAVTGRDGGEFRNAAMRLVHHLRYAAPEDDRAAETAALHALSASTTRALPQATRGAVLAVDAAQARERLRALAQGEPGPGIVGPRTTRRRDGVMFLFTGTAERPARLGRALAARYPAFAAALNEITDAVVAAGGPRIWTPRFGFHPATGSGEYELGLLASFVHGIALARLVESWGVHPDAVCGYGFGELAAGVVAGLLTPADGARLAVAEAARAPGSAPDEWVSALIGGSPEELARLLEPLRPAVAVVAVHGPSSVLVRGEPRPMEAVARRAERRGMPVFPVAADDPIAAAAQMIPARHDIVNGLGPSVERSPSGEATTGIRPATLDGQATGGGHSPGTGHASESRTAPGSVRVRPEQLGLGTPRARFYSTVRAGEVFATCAPEAHYWTDETDGPVHLAAAMARAVRDGVGTVLEFAAHPALTPALRRDPRFAHSAHAVSDRDDEISALLLALAELHADGRFVDWSGQGPFTGEGPRRRWRRGPVRSPLPLVTDCAAATVDAGEIGEHALGATGLVPTGYWVRTLLDLAAPAEMMVDFVVHDRLGPDALGAIECRDDGPAGLRAYVGDVPVVSARPLSGPAPADIVEWMRVVDAVRSARHRMRDLGGADFYALLRRHGVEYGPRSRVLARLGSGGGHAYGVLDGAGASLVSIVEACLHVLVACSPESASERTWPSVPAADTLWIGADAERSITRAYATVRERGTDGLLGEVIGTDDDGVPVLALSGVRVEFIEREAAARDARPEVAPFRTQVWLPAATGAETNPPRLRRLLVVGASDTAARLARATDPTVPTEHVATAPDVADEVVWAAAEAVDPPTGIVLVWPDGDAPEPAAALARAHRALTRACAAAGLAGLTVVLPRRALRGSGGAAGAWGIAALTRTLRLESRRRVRVVWADSDPRTLGLLADLVTIDAPGRRAGLPVFDDLDAGAPSTAGAALANVAVIQEDSPALDPAEDLLWAGDLRVGADGLAVRRFRQAQAVTSPAPRIDPDGTYVVTGGLGRRGAIAVRWLLDAGAHDVVVLTRDPRPVPGPLDGLEDRFVVVRCDVADRAELANALDDIREYGSTIRGVVHAAEDFEPAAFGAVTPDHLARLFAPKAEAARHLLELTAGDPIDFVLLFSSAAGALGARHQAGYAAASAVVDALAAGARRRRVLAVGWEIRGSDGSTAIVDDDAAGVARGAHVLTQALRSGVPHLLVTGETGD